MLSINPSYEDLQRLDLDTLLETLVVHTELYTTVIKKDGFTTQADIFRSTIVTIQRLIERKRIEWTKKKGNNTLH